MTEPLWVEKEALLLLHAKGLARFGGIEGLHDEGLQDSAPSPGGRHHEVRSGSRPAKFQKKTSLPKIRIAVGTLITECPPHRSVRADFPHTAPTWGV